MDAREFVRLVGEMLEAMDQHLAAARPVRDGFIVRTTDGYLFVFVQRADQVSPAAVERWLEAGGAPAERLVLFSPEALPDSVRGGVTEGGGTVVAGPAFANLVRQLGLDSPILGPTPGAQPPAGHYLPTVEQLEVIMSRAENWAESGVPALSLRFYRQAAALKPEYVPALVGVARSFAALGQWSEAEAAWSEVFAIHPDDTDARLGRAAALGALGHAEQEIHEYRQLVHEHPELTAAHAGLLGALIESERWHEAHSEVESMLRAAPSDAHLRFLYGLAFEHVGDEEGARTELATARAVGLTAEQEAVIRRSVEESIALGRVRRASEPALGSVDPGDPQPRSTVASKRPRTGRKRKLSSST